MRDIREIYGGTENRILEGQTWRAYRDLAAMNPSTLVYGLRSMRHLKDAWETTGKDSPAKHWGRAAHCLLLEPNEFTKRYATWSGSRKTNDYKDFQAECYELGKEVLTEEEFENLLRASENCVKCEEVQCLIKSGKPEVTLLATEGPIQCRGRVDWIAGEIGCLVDVKTTRHIEDRAFGRDFYNLQYDCKLGLYKRWLMKLTKRRWQVKVICIENQRPFDVVVRNVPEATTDSGIAKMLPVLDRLQEALDTDVWHGVGNGQEQELYVPTWEMPEEQVEFAE